MGFSSQPCLMTPEGSCSAHSACGRSEVLWMFFGPVLLEDGRRRGHDFSMNGVQKIGPLVMSK